MLRSVTSRLAIAALVLPALTLLGSTLVDAAPKPRVPVCHFNKKGEDSIVMVKEDKLAKHLEKNPLDFTPPLLAFQDTDGDGFGTGDPAMVCVAGEGTAEQDGDCLDTDALISPAAAEVLGNDVDENCDGVVEPLPDPT